MTGIDQSKLIVTQVFLPLERRDPNILIKGKYLGGGNFGKVINIHVYNFKGIF